MVVALLGALSVLAAAPTMAQLPGGSLDPHTIPKYVIPLVIPPVMKAVEDDRGRRRGRSTDVQNYEIAVRQFQQQILPGGIWDDINERDDGFDATTVWSYGPAADTPPAVAPVPVTQSQFNYPAFTIEARSHETANVRWINDLVDSDGNYLPHLLTGTIDQTAHWANPPMDCKDDNPRTDCAGDNQAPYTGPVPMVVHVHGAHVGPESDGYPEAWWLPAANNIPAGYATSGSLFDDITGTNPGDLGYVDFSYPNDQPATTLWYHDHTLGMTRNNVYAGPAGFWLIRGGQYDQVKKREINSRGKERLYDGRLPGPAPQGGWDPNFNPDQRAKIREIPIVIQDRSFNADGSLFYPDNRAFFEGLNLPPTEPYLNIPYIGDPDDPSDVLPIWNPEAFFNVMVVNGVSWPQLEVAPALYRLRFLNGCNSRFLWLKFGDPDDDDTADDIPVWQIGAEQGFLPAPVNMNAQDLDESGDGNAQVLMGLAERADVIVDFRGLPDGTEIVLQNIGPDEPFGGGIPGGEFDPADPGTTGQVMRFRVNTALLGASPTDPVMADGSPNSSAATDPADLVLVAEGSLGPTDNTRALSLNEGESELVCVEEEAVTGNVVYAGPAENGECPEDSELAGPVEALLGTYDPGTDTATPLKWTADGIGVKKTVSVANGNVDVWVTENPALGDTEEWDMYNLTADAHPIHLHLVRFQVLGREAIGGGPSIAGSNNPLPWETGYKDTVVTYPGEITTVKARFDIEGLYVWHCHIVEHEDNEMMRPYYVGN
jgi:FtsP/CotA-like multicopper oxidase with cupredoxin domain